MADNARIICILSIFLGFLTFCSTAQAQDSGGIIPQRDMKPTIQHLGPSKVIPVATRDMFYFDENGKKQELKQDFQFVGCQFKEAYADKKSRHTYYKNKVRLVISELKEEELLERGIYGVRLMAGADEQKWNVMAEYMKKDKELDFAYRVFYRVSKKKVKNLLFLTNRIEVAFSAKPDDALLTKLRADYPVEIVGEIKDSRVMLRMTDKREDSVNLANVMQRAAYIRYAVPEFIEVVGRPVSKEDVDRLPAMPQDPSTMPDPTKPPKRLKNPPRPRKTQMGQPQ